ncbi:DUF2784 domain-containing protein [Labedaea rhizosphaerae]|uniref:Uncharacterized protein DUF2784 n=1 Tax=Labedaea rhizosphaerae TaxID=598644 RepID=A0A4R6SM43_LABRH|nr:DUF2784 domain-containing protein [Labedaea rhizosphaerae]TDQ05328.1 uncharacterized protein DUF2784 [Labedaea rhizosphaerae]
MAGTLAHATVALHFLALLYIGLGGFLAWRWPKSIFVHVFFAAWGVAVNVLPLNCPLTELENYFRNQQGLSDLPSGFNAYYIYGHLFPAEYTPVVGILGLIVVIVSYVGAYVHYRHRRDEAPRDGVPIAG